MSEYRETMSDIKKTMGIVLDQFKAIPPEALPHEWAEIVYSQDRTLTHVKYHSKHAHTRALSRHRSHTYTTIFKPHERN